MFQSENISTLFIETGEGGLASVWLNKDKKIQAAVIEINVEGSVGFSGMGMFYGRGNSSWVQSKKPYNISFHNTISLDEGLSISNKWFLLANYVDDSQIRNIICNYMARKVGIPYTCNMNFVSLYINGEYQGLYNIGTKDDYLVDKDNGITAVFEQSQNNRIYNGKSDDGFYFRTRYGNTDSICRSINDFETVLYSGTASYKQLEQYADLQVFARKVFLDAICGNTDIALSQYYMLNKSKVIIPVCAWDYDFTYGVVPHYVDFAHNWIVETHPWNNVFFNYEEFRLYLLHFLADEYIELLRRDFIAYLDGVCENLNNDWKLNVIRWRNQPPWWEGQGALLSKDYDFSTLQGHKEYIVDFLDKRIGFLCGYWRSPEQYCRYTFNFNYNKGMRSTRTAMYHKGDTLTEDMLADGMLTMPDKDFKGWYTSDGTSILDVGVVTEDRIFEDRYAPKSLTTILMNKIVSDAYMLCVLFVFGCFFVWIFVMAVLIPIKEAKR